MKELQSILLFKKKHSPIWTFWNEFGFCRANRTRRRLINLWFEYGQRRNIYTQKIVHWIECKSGLVYIVQWWDGTYHMAWAQFNCVLRVYALLKERGFVSGLRKSENSKIKTSTTSYTTWNECIVMVIRLCTWQFQCFFFFSPLCYFVFLGIRHLLSSQ